MKQMVADQFYDILHKHCRKVEVKLVKCIVQSMIVDISFNQLGGLCTLRFLEQVLYRFLDYFSKFDWEKYSVSLNGPVCKSSLPDIVAEVPDNGGDDVLRSEEFIRNCVDMFSTPTINDIDESDDERL
ncbi:uncharacterized protein LOC133713680 isoform X2 [Rosa rugosa]|uniref:uncharacterized protein LOC133713680 isoform X2 n=1 Tax=Rosa rugosa TaxID=74645 RepID=UPI002B413225|nr:uncharacterized protein LOC133713680 isoform X2 [Rosa rugosa]